MKVPTIEVSDERLPWALAELVSQVRLHLLGNCDDEALPLHGEAVGILRERKGRLLLDLLKLRQQLL